MSKRLNLEEIGRMAGVSRSTVSRVVNGEVNVSDDAARRVHEVIEATGYRPHAAARSLASNRTGIFGLAIPSATSTLFHDPYFGRLILGASATTNALDVTMALFLFESEADDDPTIARVVNPGLVDGVIVTAAHIGHPLMNRLSDAGVPFVVVGRPDDGAEVFSVDVDNRGGAELAAAHLAAAGRRRLGFVSPPANTTTGRDRLAGFIDGLTTAGLGPGCAVEDRIVEGDWTEGSGHMAMERLLEAGVDGVFVGSDRMAVGALGAIRARGLSCPDDVAIVSFDGLLSPEQTSPSLTSVVQPVDQVGARAVTLLRSVLSGEVSSPVQVVLPTELAIRGSCGMGAAP